MQASILHADLDSFYASVEQRDDPRLRGRPMLVGGGIVLAASYEAKAYGVRTAMGVKQARRLCPDLVVVPPRMSAYADASRLVFSIFESITPIVEPVSIDEAFLDVGGLGRIDGDPPAIAQRLRERIRAEAGLPITVGVASTKHCAKVASQAGKPDGLLVVPAGAETDFLWPLPASRLWGVGKKTTERLSRLGIATIGDLAVADVTRLAEHIGKAHAHQLVALANNRDPRHVDTERRRKSIGSQRSFPGGGLTGDDAWVIMIELVDSITAAMRTKNIMGRTVTLNLRNHDFDQFSRSSTLPEASWSSTVIGRAARALFTRNEDFLRSGSCTKIGVSISNLTTPNSVQQVLDFEPGRPPEVDEAIDEITRRFGRDAIARVTTNDRRTERWGVPPR